MKGYRRTSCRRLALYIEHVLHGLYRALHVGQRGFDEGRRVGQGYIHAGNAADGGVEVVEGAVLDHVGQFRADAGQWPWQWQPKGAFKWVIRLEVEVEVWM